MNEIITNYKKIINEIKNSEKRFIEQKVNLIAVSKTFPPEKIKLLLDLGHKVFGENRVQESLQKWKELKKKYLNVDLHLIGPLQTNKVKQALELFDCIQTIDREKLVKKIDEEIKVNPCYKNDKRFFIQVNTGSESQKSGLKPSEVEEFFHWCFKEKSLNIIGLMCIPPQGEQPSVHFKILQDIAEKLELKHTSMGMSSDFIEAIENGATYVRLGSQIFGKRNNVI